MNNPIVSDEELKTLFNAAWEARENAPVPLSGFKVGAVIRTTSGKQYSGCNIETGAAKVCLCAEHCALYKALSEGEREFDLIVIVAQREVVISPCGHCRQVLSEFAPNIQIFSENQNGMRKSWTIQELLPEAYQFKTQ